MLTRRLVTSYQKCLNVAMAAQGITVEHAAPAGGGAGGGGGTSPQSPGLDLAAASVPVPNSPRATPGQRPEYRMGGGGEYRSGVNGPGAVDGPQSAKEVKRTKRILSETSRQLKKTVVFLEEQAAALLTVGESLQEAVADSCTAKAEVATNRRRLSNIAAELLATIAKALADYPGCAAAPHCTAPPALPVGSACRVCLSGLPARPRRGAG